MLTREEILKQCSAPRGVVLIDVAGFGQCYAKSITAAQAYRLDLEFYKETQSGEIINGGKKARLVAMCLCDETGKALFTSLDGHAIGGMPVDVLDKLYAECEKACGFGQLEATAKN